MMSMTEKQEDKENCVSHDIQPDFMLSASNNVLCSIVLSDLQMNTHWKLLVASLKEQKTTRRIESCRQTESMRQKKASCLLDSREAFVSQDSLVTFWSAICTDALLMGIDASVPTGGVPSPCAHLPLLPQSAVPCGAPDVARRIIHTHTLMKVSIWPRTRILSPGTIQAWGHWAASLQPCCCGIYQIQQCETPRTAVLLFHCPLLSARRKACAKVVHSWESLGCDREVKQRGTEQDKLIPCKAERSEQDLFTLAAPQAHADNNEALAWQERHQHYSSVSQLTMFFQSK